MAKDGLIGYEEAFRLTVQAISPLEVEIVQLSDCTDRVTANDLFALVDSPSADVSLKDGYAVCASDIGEADSHRPVRLKLLGVATAGGNVEGAVKSGTAIRILTGARVPEGADAVVAEEFTRNEGNIVTVLKHAEPGRNILIRGSDVALGELMLSSGSRLTPGRVGMLAAAGHSHIELVRQVRVGIIATGDEIIAPGEVLPEGKLYASNLMTLKAWCDHYGMYTSTDIVRDDVESISEKLDSACGTHDAVLTSGGAWKGDRDFVSKVLEQLGWEKIYHRVKIGPGKAVGFGILKGKPVFILPGGPPSNLMAFLQLALPGLLRLAGHKDPRLPQMSVTLMESVKGQIDWTQFIFGRFHERDGSTYFQSLKKVSRLRSMSEADGIISIPEGMSHIEAGEEVRAQIL